MRKLIIFLIIVFLSVKGFAQEKANVKRNNLKGPAYKNYKPWLHKTKPVTIYIKKNKVKLMGPAFKNRKVWNTDKNTEYVAINITGSKRQKLTGPSYKNYKYSKN